MKSDSAPSSELAPLTPIRVETALSRYPVHRLAKHGEIAINIREKNESGEVAIRWEVNHVSKFGQPGPLAYKLDTLIINRRIEEVPRPIPRIIKLGSLHDICKELGISEGKTKTMIKRALYQNASAFITARIQYRQNGGGEKSLEAGFNRYSVVLTGEKLPNGRKANAVYIVLSDIYMQVINGATTRPLDYDYLKILPPASQRFYELLSYQMYAAIKNDRLRAKLLYSELCTYAPLVRQFEWDQVRPQLARIHTPHKQSGYIAKVDFQDTVDSAGHPDWIMLYQPGPKARAEFRTFTKRGGPVVLEVEPFTDDPLPQLTAPESASPLEVDLIEHGITDVIARQLVAEHPEDIIRQQIEILDWRLAGKKADKIDDPAAWLVSAIKHPHAPPKGFLPRAERQRREEARQARERETADELRRKQQEEAQARKEREAITAFWDALTPEQQATHDAAAIAKADAEELKLIEPGPLKRFGMTILRDKHIRQLLQDQGKQAPTEA